MRDAEFEQRLLRVARGLEKADLVLKGGNVFNSFARKNTIWRANI